jgi:hypothetical protein
MCVKRISGETTCEAITESKLIEILESSRPCNLVCEDHIISKRLQYN